MPFAQFIVGAVIAFIYGIVVGSFLNVCIYRLPNNLSVSTPPSHCPSCSTRLRPRDLVPLFSFLFLKGKCRYCGTPISWRYFTIEFITGLLFVAFWWMLAAKYPDAITTLPVITLVVLGWIFAAAMLVTFMIDLDTTYVILPVTWVAMAAGVLYEIVHKWVAMQDISYTVGGITIPYLPAAVPGMIIGFLIFRLMDWFGQLIFRKPGMGLGDSFIGAAMGAMLGPGLLLISVGIAVVLGAVIGIVLMAVGSLKRSPAPDAPKTSDDELPEGVYMPFGPFLTASAVLVALLPEWITANLHHAWNWWLNLFA